MDARFSGTPKATRGRPANPATRRVVCVTVKFSRTEFADAYAAARARKMPVRAFIRATALGKGGRER